MKLTVLIDNNTYIDEYYIGEPALSYYIEDENERKIVGVRRFSSIQTVGKAYENDRLFSKRIVT